MALDTDEGNSSWNLSFDDEFDTSSDSFAPETSSKRVFSSSSDEGYKSSPSASHVRSDEKHQQGNTAKMHTRPASHQKKKSFQSIGLGHAHASQNATNSSTPKSKASSNSRHRQASSMVYTSSPSQKWHGRPIDITHSPRQISPHNSPLMSSFARAQDHQERITAGTLSGLLVRFLRGRTASSLSIRLSSFVLCLLLTTLLVTRGNESTSNFSSSRQPYMVLGTLDDDANLLAARAILQSQVHEQLSSAVESQVAALEAEEDETRMTPQSEEDIRIAHDRAVKAHLRSLKVQQARVEMQLQEQEEQEEEQAEEATPAAETVLTSESLQALAEVEEPLTVVPRQRSFTKLIAEEEDGSIGALTEETEDQFSLPVEEDEGTSMSELKDYILSEEGEDDDEAAASETESDLPLEDETDLSLDGETELPLKEESEQAEKMDEELNAEQAPATLRKGSVPEETAEAQDDSAGDNDRSALLERLQLARQLAQVKYGELQTEREIAGQPAGPPSDDLEELVDEFLDVELDEKEVMKPGVRRT